MSFGFFLGGLLKFDVCGYASLEEKPSLQTVLKMPADNSLVAFLLIVGGLTLAVLTATLLIYTGVMTGSFISNMMRKRGITPSALSGFLTHGIPEMSTILFAGAVGLEIGHIATKFALDSYTIEVRSLVVHTVRRFSTVFLMLVISAFLEVYITH